MPMPMPMGMLGDHRELVFPASKIDMLEFS
jgi:hypothetical protein